MAKSLIVGYGNSLRSDDGIGVRVAEIINDWQLPEVRSLAQPQLTPELAADLAKVGLVIFVDACQAVDRESIEIYALNPVDRSEVDSHHSDPLAILSLTKLVYGKCPQAWWIVVPGINFQLGESLSPVAQAGVTQALTEIRELISNQ